MRTLTTSLWALLGLVSLLLEVSAGILEAGWEGTGLQPCLPPLQVTFCDPVIERRPRLQRQQRIFSKRRGMDRRGFCV